MNTLGNFMDHLFNELGERYLKIWIKNWSRGSTLGKLNIWSLEIRILGQFNNREVNKLKFRELDNKNLDNIEMHIEN